MPNLVNMTVVGFGKVIFVSKNHTVPALPDMNLIVLKKESVYQAICIDIEIDAVGDNLKECCDNLKRTLLSYITQMVDNYKGNVKAAIEDIVNVAYAPGDIKSTFFAQYLQAKHKYLLEKIAKKNKAKSRQEVFVNAWKRIFQFEPIQFDITEAASFA